ncbi:MAG TPA: type II secretion system protein, partial [Synergistaceae bacterium]|nr:type II secretion system protein [Synergistaceae bacterium]
MILSSPGGARRPPRGFTLVEILLVLALVGIVAAVGIAPVVHTVGLLTRVEDDFAEDTAFRLAASRMAGDWQSLLPVPQG